MKSLDPASAPLEGFHLIEASAGTGKTYSIELLYLRLILEADLSPEEILVVTYTRAASAELNERIRRRLTTALAHVESAPSDPLLAKILARHNPAHLQHQLKHALSGFDRSTITTIHGFAAELLREHAIDVGEALSFEITNDVRPWLRDFVADYWSRRWYREDPDVAELLVSKVSAQQCMRWAEFFERHRDVVMVSAKPASAGLRDALDGWRSAREKALSCFDAERLRTALASKALKRGSYHPATVERWLACVELSRPFPDRDLREALCRLAFENLRAKKGHEPPNDGFFDAASQWLRADRALDTAIQGRVAELRRDFVDQLHEELPKRLRRAGQQSFDGMLRQVHDALSRSHGTRLGEDIRRRFKAALIDEFQDTDALQYQVFYEIFGKHCLIVIGDPKQAIYAFRGADVFVYFQAAKAAGVNRYQLPTNYRSDPSLIRAVETVFTTVPLPFVFDDLRFRPVSAAPDARDEVRDDPLGTAAMHIVNDDSDSPLGSKSAAAHASECAARLIAQTLNSSMKVGDRPVESSDFAVLLRTNAQAIAVQQKLRDRGIPSAFRGVRSVFESQTAEDLQTVLAALVEPSHQSALRAALLTSLLAVSADDLLSENTVLLAETQRFVGFRATWHEHGIAAAMLELAGDFGLESRLLAETGGERVLTDFNHLSELLHRAEHEGSLGPARLADWLRARRSDPDRGDAHAELRLETDRAAVQLMTIHTAKGLEFPLVVCPELWCSARASRHGELALFHLDGLPTVDLQDPRDSGNESQHHQEALSESRRLLYVALTRAKHRLYLVWGPYRGVEQSALGSLLTSDHGLDDLVARSGGTIDLVPADTLADTRLQAVQIPRHPATRRRFSGPIRVARRSSSYSSWVESTKLLPPAGLSAVAHANHPRALPESAGYLTGFSASATTGLMVHTFLEALDFSNLPDAQGLDDLAVSVLRRFGGSLGASGDLTTLARRLADLALPVGDERHPLSSASASATEVDFTLRLNFRAAWRQNLTRALHESGGIYAAYAPRFLESTKTVLRGVLRGSIDWCGELGGSTLLIDYKTNTLQSYDVDNVTSVMVDEHYVLQGLLYATAWRHHMQRWSKGVTGRVGLGQRDMASTARRDLTFAGAFYLFVRGLDEPGSVVHLNPPSRLLDAFETHLLGSDDEN